jgi:hypothetical protein
MKGGRAHSRKIEIVDLVGVPTNIKKKKKKLEKGRSGEHNEKVEGFGIFLFLSKLFSKKKDRDMTSYGVRN